MKLTSHVRHKSTCSKALEGQRRKQPQDSVYQQQRKERKENWDPQQQRRFLDSLVGIGNYDQLYRLSYDKFRDSGGANLLRRYQNSPASVVITNYPEHCWKLWKFNLAPKGFWCIESQRAFLVDLVLGESYIPSLLESFPPESYNAFYDLTNEKILQHGGAQLIQDHGSAAQAVMRLFPHHDWEPWRFQKLPRGFWGDLNLQRKFIHHVAIQLMHSSNKQSTGQKDLTNRNENDKELLYEHLYSITADHIKQFGGKHLLQLYGGSPFAIIEATHPEHTWLPWKFKGTPRGWWLVKANQKQYLQWLCNTVGIKFPKEIHKLTHEHFYTHNGGYLLNIYGSHTRFLSLITSDDTQEDDLHLLPWKATYPTPGWWRDSTAVKRFVEWLMKREGLQSLNQCYTLSLETVIAAGGAAVLRAYGNSLPKLLTAAFPHHKWDETQFVPRTRTLQAKMKQEIEKLVPTR